MSKDPIRLAFEAAVQPLIVDALAKAKRDIIAAVERAFAGVGSTEAPAPVKAKRERHVEKEAPPSQRKRRRRTLVSPDRVAEVERLILTRTMTDSAIARAIGGVHQATVSRIRAKLGIPAIGMPINMPGQVRGKPVAVEVPPPVTSDLIEVGPVRVQVTEAA